MGKDTATVRKQAWATRRAKYGDKGHDGSYSANGRCAGCHSMRDAIVRLHNEEILSEGQTAKILKCGRVAVRDLAITQRNRTTQQGDGE